MAGLSIGFGVCLVIVLFIHYHLGFDTHHTNAEQIYRISNTIEINNKMQNSGNMQAPLAPTLVQEIPGVREAVRFNPANRLIISIGENKFYEDNILQTDPAYFRVFDVTFIRGNPESALTDKNDIILTQSAARKYFQNQNPMGQDVVFNEDKIYTVAGVVEDPVSQSHLDYSMLINIPDSVYGVDITRWNFLSAFFTYLLLDKNTSPEEVLSQVPAVLKGKVADAALERSNFQLQALSDIHLRSELNYELVPERIFDINYIYIFSLVGILILLIASVNYINLSIARATTRLKEVGIRKSAGAQRNNLFWQFIGEFFLLPFLASILAIAFAEALLPFINDLLELHITSEIIWTPTFLMGYFSGIFCISLISGIYPALVLSSYNPANIFSGHSKVYARGTLRKSLVMFQFTIGVVLVISTLIIHKQLRYFQNANLGLNPEQLLYTKLESSGTKAIASVFQQKLSENPDIVSVTASESIPGRPGVSRYIYLNGRDASPISFRYNWVDTNFLSTMGIELIAGRDFEPSDAARNETLAILNERAVIEMGSTADQILNQEKEGLKIIGIVKDYHFESFHNNIRPAAIVPLHSRNPSYISLRLKTNNISETIEWIKNEWAAVAGSVPFEYQFLDDTYDNLYRSEQKLATLFNFFAFIAIFISSMGLFGLISFIAIRRTKEIGIRKVLGASISNIVILLSKDFVRSVLIAICIAIPIAWYTMNQWLADFAYRIEIGAGIFLLAGGAAMLIALLTVSWQSVKAAMLNPVESLRSE